MLPFCVASSKVSELRDLRIVFEAALAHSKARPTQTQSQLSVPSGFSSRSLWKDTNCECEAMPKFAHTVAAQNARRMRAACSRRKRTNFNFASNLVCCISVLCLSWLNILGWARQKGKNKKSS